MGHTAILHTEDPLSTVQFPLLVGASKPAVVEMLGKITVPCGVVVAEARQGVLLILWEARRVDTLGERTQAILLVVHHFAIMAGMLEVWGHLVLEEEIRVVVEQDSYK